HRHDASTESLLRERGIAYLKLDRAEAAASDLREALKIEEDDARARLGLASALAALKRHAEALVECDRTLAQDPNDPAPRRLRASILYAMDRLDEALVEAREVLKRVPATTIGAHEMANIIRAIEERRRKGSPRDE